MYLHLSIRLWFEWVSVVPLLHLQHTARIFAHAFALQSHVNSNRTKGLQAAAKVVLLCDGNPNIMGTFCGWNSTIHMFRPLSLSASPEYMHCSMSHNLIYFYHYRDHPRP